MHHDDDQWSHIGSVRFLDLFFRNHLTISDVLAKMDSGGLFFRFDESSGPM